MAMEEYINSLEQLRLEESARDPIPPFTYNVYIAHSFPDSLLVAGAENSLCKILEERFNIKCYPRHLPGSGNSVIKEIIDRGVWASEKCLILMTDNYCKDPYSSYEIEQIHGKARSCSKDMVTVLWLNEQQNTDEFTPYINITGQQESLKPVTDNYRNVQYSSYEIEQIHGQAESCSNDMVIVLRNQQQETEEVNPYINITGQQESLKPVTDNYRNVQYSSYEIEQIHGQAESCSNDVVIVLRNQQQKTEEFTPYINIRDWIDLTSLCNSGEKLRQLAQIIIKPPMASLTCLPKENIGYGAATGFFYGFLRLVLPDFRSRFRDATKSDAAAVPGMLKDSVCKMLIILPRSCFCATEIKDGNRIENVKDLFVKRWANRAGNVKRDYKSSVYKLTDQNSQKEYYFAGELATPLLTMYESYSNGLLGMTLNQLYRERDIFCFTLHQVLQHPENKECNNQYRIIMWDDRKDANDHFGTPLYDLLLPILKEELAKEKREQDLVSATPPILESDTETRSDNNAVLSRNGMTYEHIDVKDQSMTAIYERSQFTSYPLRNGVRGKAVIFNIINYSVASDAAARLLPTRTGADHDGAKMKELFRDLGFEPETHQDVSRERLGELLSFYSGTLSHTNYDAFICCIMTHGNLGEIFTSDGLPYQILDVVDWFSSTNCRSLRGKPKLFFVQSCQKATTDSDSVTNSTTALHRESSGRIQTDADTDPHGRAADRAEASDAASATGGDATGGSGAGASRQSSTGSNRSWEFLTPERRAMLVPGEPDILMSYSALPGSVSYRDPHHGSLYIDALATNLRKDLEIDRALKMVTADVTMKLQEHARGSHTTYAAQLPFHLTTGMSKLLFLTPTKPEEITPTSPVYN